MSRDQRLALLAGVVAVAVAAFVIAKPDDGEKAPRGSTQPTTETTRTTTETAGTTTKTAQATKPQQPGVQRVVVKGGKPVGGVRTLEFKAGDDARIDVSADAPDVLHLHGYDIERKATPARPASFRFKADAEGEFELESHTAEDAGREPLIARVVVKPSD